MKKLRKKESIYENIFDFYSYCIDRQSWGQTKTMLVWILSVLELMLYTLNRLNESGLVASESLASICKFTQYAQLTQLKTISQSAYLVVSVIIKSLIAVNFLLGLSFFFTGLRIIHISKIKEFFCSYNTYTMFLLNIVFAEVVFSDILAIVREGSNTLQCVINVAVIVFMVTCEIKYSFFLQFEAFGNENYLVAADPFFYFKTTVIKFFVTLLLFVGLNVQQRGVQLAAVIVLLVVSMGVFLSSLFSRMMENDVANRTVTSLIGLQLAILISFVVNMAYNEFNFLAGFASIAVCTLIVSNLKKTMYDFDNKKLNNQTAILNFIYRISDLAKECDIRPQSSIVLKGLLSAHQAECTRTSCFCSTELFYVSSKSAFVSANIRDNTGLFVRQMIRQRLEDLRVLYPQNFTPAYIYALFCHRRLKNRVLAVRVMKEIDSNQLGLLDRFKFYRLSRLIVREQDELNRDRLKNRGFEELLQFEEALGHFTMLVNQLFFNLYGFWTFMFGNVNVCPKEFCKQTTHILSIKLECEGLLNVMSSFTNHSDKIKFLFGLVRRELLNQPVSERLDELYNSLEDQELPSFATDLSMLNVNFYLNFLRGNSCVFELGLTPRNVGIIQRASETVSTLFGIPRLDILGQSINTLMPGAIAEVHDNILLDLFERGITRSKTNSISSWALKHNAPIEVGIKYKVGITVESDIVLTGLVTQTFSTSHPKHYIVTDDLGFITDASEILLSALGINILEIREGKINVGMLSKHLFRALPIKNALSPEENRLTEFTLLNMNSVEKRITLVLSRHPDERNRLEALFSSLKSITRQSLKAALDRHIYLRYDHKTHSFVSSPANSNSKKESERRGYVSIHEHNPDKSEDDAADASSESNYKNPFASLVLSAEELNESEDRLSSENRTADPDSCNQVTGHFEIIPKRHTNIPDFNVFVFKKIDLMIASQMFGNRSQQIVFSQAKNDLLSVTSSRRSESINISNYPIELSPNQSKVEKYDISAQSNSKFLPYIKQTLNIFYKDAIQIPIKHYPKIFRYTALISIILTMFFTSRAFMLFTIKLPMLQVFEQFIDEHSSMRLFEYDLLTVFNIMLSAVPFYTPESNLTYVALDRIQKAKQHIQNPAVMKYIFIPDLNSEYESIVLPGYTLNINNSFLLHSYIYDLNKNLLGQETFGFTSYKKLAVFMQKYIVQVPSYFHDMEAFFKQYFQEATDKMTINFSVSYFAEYGVLIVCLVLVIAYMIWMLYKIFSINDTVLYIEDQTIVSIINYYTLAQRFFVSHFGSSYDPFSNQMADKSTVMSDVFSREKRRRWSRINKRNKWFATKMVMTFMCLVGCWSAACFVDFFIEKGMINSLIKAQEIGMGIISDKWSVNSLTMTAKAFYQQYQERKNLPVDTPPLPPPDPAVLAHYQKLNDNLDNALRVAIVADDEGNSVETLVKSYYKKPMCEYLNQTLSAQNITCSDVYHSILDSNINAIKSILSSKLGFIKTLSNPDIYNYTVPEIISLDQALLHIEEGFNIILKDWLGSYASMRSTYQLFFIIGTITMLLCTVISYFLTVIFTVKPIDRFYRHERAVFLSFMPAETLRKTKIAQVQLIRDEVLRPR